MCGFTGFWDFHCKISEKKPILEEMLSKIQNRGPDSEGITFIDGIAFGHKRLSIVDLTPSGHQPMFSHSRRFVMVYNGNIFNTQELRKEVSHIIWKGTSDTEVILELFEKYGIHETVKKLIGMFSISVYDRNEKKLYLVRDRVGIKPMYYGLHDNTFFFGSQVKSFLPHPFFPQDISEAARDLFFYYNYIPAPHSIYKHIFKLQPGHILEISHTQDMQTFCFWSMEEAALKGRQNLIEDEQEALLRLEDLLTDSIKRRMMADVPLGAFLSGGVDSSLVVSLMQKVSSFPIQTFTVGFEEEQYNEAHYAAKVAQHLKTTHFEEYMPIQSALSIIPEIPEYCDEPFADSSQIPTLLVSRIAKKHVTIALSGDGGDEFYAGYGRYFDVLKALRINQSLPPFLKKIITSSYKPLSPLLSRILPLPLSRRLKIANQVLSLNHVQDIYEMIWNRWPEALSMSSFPLSDSLKKGLSELAYMQYYDSVQYLPDDILVKVDRASMHTSLEARVPLLDHRLIELSWSIPDHMKYQKGVSKSILRKILYKYVPKELIERPKMGFGVPIDEWLRGPLKDWAWSLIEDFKDDSLFPLVKQYMDDHQKKKMNNQYSLWGILMWQQWKNYYKTNHKI